MKLIIVFFLAALLLSCNSNKRPGNILSPEKMQVVLWDYISADIYSNNYIPKDSGINIENAKLLLQEKMFQKNKVTKEVFNESYTWYQKNGDVMKVILDSMIAKKTRSMEKERMESYKPKSL